MLDPVFATAAGEPNQFAWDTNGRVSIHARTSLTRHATERGPSRTGSGNCESFGFSDINWTG